MNTVPASAEETEKSTDKENSPPVSGNLVESSPAASSSITEAEALVLDAADEEKAVVIKSELIDSKEDKPPSVTEAAPPSNSVVKNEREGNCYWYDVIEIGL